MKFSKSQSYSLLAAMVAVASTTSAHRAHVQPFGPELSHKDYQTPSSVSNGLLSHHSFFAGSASNPEQVAIEFVEKQVTNSDYIVKNAYTSKHNGVTHVYLKVRLSI